MNKSEKRKAERLCEEFHKEEPDWELVRMIICDLAGKRLRPLPKAKSINVIEIAAMSEKEWNKRMGIKP